MGEWEGLLATFAKIIMTWIDDKSVVENKIWVL
jgi:hypothetical protein